MPESGPPQGSINLTQSLGATNVKISASLRGNQLLTWMPFRHTFSSVQFDWDPAKNEQLKDERGISFEEIALLLGSGHLWAVTDHWNQRKYPKQRVFLVPVDGYIYAVPFVEEDDVIFLKTAFPSRKLTKQYQQEKENEQE